jgi:predicted double-glycine peptidase
VYRSLFSVLIVLLLGGCAARQGASITLRDLFAFRQVVRQQFETSCGAAAVATILTYFFNEPTTEADILRLVAPEEKAPSRGLSIDDLKRAALARGYRVASHQIELSVLQALPEPAIVVLCPTSNCPPNIFHFSVFQGSTSTAVRLADSSRGELVMGLESFNKIWSGFVLVLGKNVNKNRDFFLPPTHVPSLRPLEYKLPR